MLHDVVLAGERTTIGRGPQNDIVLAMRSVSARHAMISMLRQECFVEDLNSTNGTQVNGQPIRKHCLQNNDVIRLAGYELRYDSTVPRMSDQSLAEPAPVAKSELFHIDASVPRGETAIAGATASSPAPMPVIRILTGPDAGREVNLTKSLTTIGCPGVQVAVITRRPQGFLITHVEGDVYPLVNSISIGAGATPIESGCVLDLSGTEMIFLLR
ncbi:hypothetical protein GCM10022212_22110 [Actimicrobium antarcticum]|uniref:FHA domain-containing protein n=1 Tax=Actimicrobium antarcticum TaxID=1051899 RepID=A0ABP7TC34_9BURK